MLLWRRVSALLFLLLKETRKGVRGLSPKADQVMRDCESLSVCSFDSDFSDEGWLEGERKEERKPIAGTELNFYNKSFQNGPFA